MSQSTTSTSATVSPRLAAALPMAAVGIACIVAGGLLAAATAFVTTYYTAWVTAYLVLVAGIAAVAFGVGQAYLPPKVPATWLVYTELALFYLGNVGTVMGAVASQPLVSYGGGAALVLALILFIYGARGARPGRLTWLLYLYRILLVIVLVSIPVGLVISHLTA